MPHASPHQIRATRPGRPQHRHRHRHRVGVAWRRWIERHPRWYWAAVGVILAASFWSAHERSTQVARNQASWGTTARAWCAADAIDPGDTVADSVYRCEVPAAFMPSAAVREADGLAAQHIDPGSVLTEADVTAGDTTLALAPDGWVAVTIIERVPSGATTGERILLASDGVVVADDAIVLEDRGDAHLVAVPGPTAAIVAAAANGDISILRAAPAKPAS